MFSVAPEELFQIGQNYINGISGENLSLKTKKSDQ